MYSNHKNILFYWKGKEIPDYNHFIKLVEDSLYFIAKSKKKKIVTCLIELAQNVFSHNLNQIADVVIVRDDKINLQVSNQTSETKAKQLKEIFNKLLSMNKLELKELYYNNLTSKSKYKKVGNGLLICLLKSDKNMNLLINNTKNNEKLITFSINFEI